MKHVIFSSCFRYIFENFAKCARHLSDTPELPDTLPDTCLDTFWWFLKILYKAEVAHHNPYLPLINTPPLITRKLKLINYLGGETYDGAPQSCIGFGEIIKKCPKQCPEECPAIPECRNKCPVHCGFPKKWEDTKYITKTQFETLFPLSTRFFWQFVKLSEHFFRHPGMAGDSCGHCFGHFLMIS